jgi:hypothetical protein
MNERAAGDQPGEKRTAKTADGCVEFTAMNLAGDSDVGHSVVGNLVDAFGSEP